MWIEAERQIDLTADAEIEAAYTLIEVIPTTEQSATAAPNAGMGGQRPDTTVKPEIDWRDLYRGMEGPLCEAVHMTQIADGLVDHVDHNVSDSREQLAFAVNHSPQLLEDLRRRYYEHDRTED